MGILRFILATVVIMFHAGGAGLMSGRLAVMGFYVISGYLIIRVYDQRYQGRFGTLRFYLNRILRLYPLYLVLWFLSYLAYNFGGPVSVELTDPPNWLPGQFILTWRDLLLLLSFKEVKLSFFSAYKHYLIPQAWSLDVEMFFYLFPLFTLFFGKRKFLFTLFLVSFVSYLYSLFSADSFKEYEIIYRNALLTAWFFAFGGLIYFYESILKKLLPKFLTIDFVVVLLILLLLGLSSGRYLCLYIENSFPLWKYLVTFLNVVVALLVAIFIVISDKSSDPFRKLGDFSYGMYLNHLLVAWFMMWLSGKIGFYVFGRINELSFGVFTVVGSVLFSWLTFTLIERPLQKIRSRIRSLPSFKQSLD